MDASTMTPAITTASLPSSEYCRLEAIACSADREHAPSLSAASNRRNLPAGEHQESG
jgi:hypothetical protein